jgi:hypothetical protein
MDHGCPFLRVKALPAEETTLDYKAEILLVLSSLMLGFLEQLPVFMLAHLFFAPFYNVAHRLTSFKKNSK